MTTPIPENLVIKRFDTFRLPRVGKTKTGYLQGDIVASRVGVFEYMNSDGTIRRELRHPEEVFKEDSLDTLKMIPVTDNHPNEFVDSSNAATLQKGYTGESWRIDGDNIIVSLTVTDRATVRKIMSGEKREVSLGYGVVLVREDGIYNGEKYDYRQTCIEYNHLAVVDFARAGRVARFRMDGEEIDHDVAECRFDENNLKLCNEGEYMLEGEVVEMRNIETKNKDHAFEVQGARLDAALAEGLVKDHRISNLESRCDSLERALQEANKKVTMFEARNTDAEVNQRAINRADLLCKAAAVIGEDVRAYEHHSDREIMEVMLKGLNKRKGIGEPDFGGRGDEYVKGVFDHAMGSTMNGSARGDIKSAYSIVASIQDKADAYMSVGDRAKANAMKKNK